MAVEAVVSVVIQKVTDLLIQESKIFDKVVNQVEDIRLELRQMRGFLTDAEERQKDDDDAKIWVGCYLNTLYKVEDMVESYVFKLVHKKMKESTITACWKLRRKLKQIEEEVKWLNKTRPDNIEDASLRGLSFRREQKQQRINLSDKNHCTGSSSQTKRMLSGIWEDDDSDYENSLERRLTSKLQPLDGDAEPIQLQPLDETESWELFLKSLRNEEGICDISGNYFVRDQILEKCQGLPRNIVLLGGFLSTKINSSEWKRLFSQANWDSMDVWLLSYTDLPAHYKLCLLYLTLFPKEFDLSVRRILRLWLAEGFLRRSSGLEEDLAEMCFNDLAKRNLVEVTKFRSDGGPKKCRLPGFLREQLSPKAEEIRLFHIHHMSANPMQTSPAEPSIPQVRRIVEYADITDKDFFPYFQNLRSYFSFNFSRYYTPAKGVGDFLHRIKGFGLLRVLDLERVYKPTLSKALKHLFLLRYLGLRRTLLDSLPESVGDLPYLETLDLKRTYIKKLPSSVWKLKHLRHLNLPHHCRLDMRMQQPSSQLLTLWGINIDDGCNLENGLGLLNNLRELGIVCQLTHFNSLLKWIRSLTHLQSLSLTSKNKVGYPSRLELESLSELRKITHLKLLGKLSRLLNKDEFPPYIRVLTLSVSNLDEDPMGVLSQLQHLSVLRLLAESYCGETMQCPENGFANLRVLKLWMLNNLEEWVVELGGMPNIKELEIRSCQQLKQLPYLTTLKELVLTNMPEDFEQKVRQIYKHTILQTNHYEFNPFPWEKNPELWQPDCGINH